jgi:NADPH-dependent 2,4-dienoyl-CoA reductase/sulfur reductase-like enzyme
MEVIVLEKTQDVSYSACGMPYNIADPDRDINDLVVRHAEVFREKQNIDLRTGHKAEAIYPASKVVKGKSLDGKEFSIEYDKVLIATGASPVLPNLPGFDLPGVMALKSLEDGRRIKNFLSGIKQSGIKRAVIIGMGYIAMEMAESLRERNIEVAMVKPGPVILPWLSPGLSKMVRDELISKGVSIQAGQEIKRIEKTGDGSLNVICEDIDLKADIVVVGIGVSPNSQIAKDAGLLLGPSESITVNSRMMTSEPNIYAAGDCADAFHLLTQSRVWIPLALWANRGGWAVADNISGQNTELQGIVGTAVFKVFDLEVARTGLNAREAKKAGFNPVEIEITSQTRAHAHPGAAPIKVSMVGDKNTGRLLGTQMVAKESAAHRINAPAVALHAKMTVEEFSQSDLAYAPPFGPVWDPMLTAANQLIKKMQ